MGTVLFTAKATITKKREAAFNKWYNETHCPQVLRYPGVVSARRYRAIIGGRHVPVHGRVRDPGQEDLPRVLQIQAPRGLKKDYDRWFGKVSARTRLACVQVWP